MADLLKLRCDPSNSSVVDHLEDFNEYEFPFSDILNSENNVVTINVPRTISNKLDFLTAKGVPISVGISKFDVKIGDPSEEILNSCYINSQGESISLYAQTKADKLLLETKSRCEAFPKFVDDFNIENLNQRDDNGLGFCFITFCDKRWDDIDLINFSKNLEFTGKLDLNSGNYYDKIKSYLLKNFEEYYFVPGSTEKALNIEEKLDYILLTGNEAKNNIHKKYAYNLFRFPNRNTCYSNIKLIFGFTPIISWRFSLNIKDFYKCFDLTEKSKEIVCEDKEGLVIFKYIQESAYLNEKRMKMTSENEEEKHEEEIENQRIKIMTIETKYGGIKKAVKLFFSSGMNCSIFGNGNLLKFDSEIIFDKKDYLTIDKLEEKINRFLELVGIYINNTISFRHNIGDFFEIEANKFCSNYENLHLIFSPNLKKLYGFRSNLNSIDYIKSVHHITRSNTTPMCIKIKKNNDYLFKDLIFNQFPIYLKIDDCQDSWMVPWVKSSSYENYAASKGIILGRLIPHNLTLTRVYLKLDDAGNLRSFPLTVKTNSSENLSQFKIIMEFIDSEGTFQPFKFIKGLKISGTFYVQTG